MTAKFLSPKIWLTTIAAAGALLAACGNSTAGGSDASAARVATAKGAKVEVFTSPDATKASQKLDAKTGFGSPRAFLVLAAQDDMVEVQLPTRPNGSTGWVKASSVDLSDVPFAVRVDLGSNTLKVTKGDKVVLEDRTADGEAKYPTPTGTFYVTDLLATGNDDGAYGPFAFGLSGHSEVLTDFAGGDGQIGIHGTNAPEKLGQDVSHGCVRVSNATISKLAEMLPLGTPVFIA